MKRPSWKIRRRIVFLTLLFCAVIVFWLAVAGQDTRLNETIANGLILLAGAVIGSYVFGATWDDLNVMSKMGEEAYREPIPFAEPGPFAEPVPDRRVG